jgi:hypothetical protein
MKKRSRNDRKYSIVAMLSLVLLLFVLAACGDTGQVGTNNPASPGGPQSNTGSSTPTSTPSSAQIQLGAQPCPAAVSSPSYWDHVIPTQPAVNKVESVTCAYLMGVPALQALVNVRTSSAASTLSVYVYNNITNPDPTQIFSLLNLYKGQAKISGYNTVLTAQVDQSSSVNVNKNGNYSLDLFREFKWSDGAGTLAQIAFPGLFPDLTRYQAEQDQQQVNQGQRPWELDAAQTASTFAARMLQWPNNSPTHIVSGGGQHDVNATVNVVGTAPGGNTIQLGMSRLENNTNGGIWIITEVSTTTPTGLALKTPAPLDRLNSPVTVSGSGPAFEGQIGTITILDHTLTDIGHASASVASGSPGMGQANFSSTVTYTSTFHDGAEEGIVALYTRSNANGSIAGAVMQKQLLA